MNTAAIIKQKPAVTHLYHGTWKKKYGEKKLVRGCITQPRFLSHSSACSSTLTNNNPTPPTRKRKPMNSIATWSPSINSNFSAMPNVRRWAAVLIIYELARLLRKTAIFSPSAQVALLDFNSVLIVMYSYSALFPPRLFICCCIIRLFIIPAMTHAAIKKPKLIVASKDFVK